MKLVGRILQLFHTLKYLRYEQFYYRALYKFKKPVIGTNDTLGNSANSWRWNGPVIFEQSVFQDGDCKDSLIENSKVVFLNTQGFVNTEAIWNSPEFTKLWLYNLHYFDDLNAFNYSEREFIHYQFIDKWIAENPPCSGNGWEPYPISLRLVNWVKWFSKKDQVDARYLTSIAQQAQALSQQLEYHILGNHLFANAKALTFVGCFLTGKQADKFLHIGLQLLDREVAEQFLADGAHFELSPMYHEILLWDLLDLINLAKESNNAQLLSRLKHWKFVASNALTWLSSMVHNDGEISFFNDAAIGIAATPEQVFSYAKQLGLDCDTSLPLLTTNIASGYSRIEQVNYSVIFDHANVGPDYLPGHAHADTLSFEMSVGTQRLFVNSGTSLYGVSNERLRQRKTAAHNTIVVEDADSSEVWSGFRVARRAYAKLINAEVINQQVTISASHDGYCRLKPKVIHNRTLVSSPRALEVTDTLSEKVDACFHLHLHPEVQIVKITSKQITLQLPSGTQALVTCSQPISVVDSTWHPQFGVSIENKKLIVLFNSATLESTIQILKD
jgi:uncharacterized heparinase superfamily protein